MSSRSALFALFVLSVLASSASADDQWTVSCSQNGRPVHLEKISPDDNVREAQIMQRYPEATCVFLSPKMAKAATPDFDDYDGEGDYGGLQAALRAITGEDLGLDFSERSHIENIAAGKPLALSLQVDDAIASEPIHESFKPLETAPQYRPQSPDWVRLGVYKTATISDALADWSRLTREESVFRYLTPAVSKMPDGYLMLSAGPVTSENRDIVCLAAAAARMDCLPGQDRQVVNVQAPSAMDGARYLAYAIPGALTSSFATEQCVAVPSFSLSDQIPPDRKVTLECLKTPYSGAFSFPKYTVPPSIEAPGPPGPDIPLPRARPAHEDHRVNGNP